MDTTIPRRMAAIETARQQGNAVAAVFPIHYPRALLRAFGFLPVEVWGPPGIEPGQGAAHIQPYVCSIVRNIFSFLHTGGLDVADILVTPHTCDSTQGLGSILLDFTAPEQPVFPIYLPRGRRESDIVFLSAELRALYGKLAAFTGRTPSDEELLASIRREEQADDLLAQLHRQRLTLPQTGPAFYALVRSREYLPAETFIPLAQAALDQAGDTRQTGIPIILSGIVPEPMTVLDDIAEMGGLIVADDLACCGRRLYPPGSGDDPFRRMAESLIHAPPDPTRGNPIHERLDFLAGKVERTGAKGIIFYEIKFCEPEAFDLPDLRKGLQDQGIPSLVVEIDINDKISHQIRTRIGAFLEML